MISRRNLSLFIVELFCLIASTLAQQRMYGNVFFSAAACQKMGYANDFAECAVMEFCTSPRDRDRLVRHRRFVMSQPLTTQNSTIETSLDFTFQNEVEEAEGEQGRDDHRDSDFWEQQKNGQEHNMADDDNVEPLPKGMSVRTGAPNEAMYGWRLPGDTACSWPGPTLRLRRGVNHGLVVKGSSGAPPTNLHFHGLHIAGHGNGDDLYRSVEGNDNALIYGINLPADQHLGGTHWYHSHMSGASWEQVKGGAFGMIIVDDNGHDVGTNDEHVLAFLTGELILIFDNTSGDWKVNGLQKERLDLIKDEWYRLRLLVVSTDSYDVQDKLQFGSGCEVRPIAHDGVLRFEVPGQKIEVASLTTSSRLDVAIQCSANSNIGLTGQELAVIKVDSLTRPSLASPFESGTNTWLSRRLEYTKDLLNLEPAQYFTVKVSETNINEINSSQHKPLCDNRGMDFQYGTILSLELHGANSHPFHLHMYPMQVASEGCGSGHAVGEFYDTIVTANSDSRAPCSLRVHLIDVAGPTFVHCHIFEHAEHGALGWFNVEGGPIQTGPTCVAGGHCGESDVPLPKCSKKRQLR